MPKRKQSLKEAALRVTRHRHRLAIAGHRRLELTVPADDVALLRQLAAGLRAGGPGVDRLRAGLRALLRSRRPLTGRDLVAFFRASPLVGVDLDIGRDRSPGRPIDL